MEIFNSIIKDSEIIGISPLFFKGENRTYEAWLYIYTRQGRIRIWSGRYFDDTRYRARLAADKRDLSVYAPEMHPDRVKIREQYEVYRNQIIGFIHEKNSNENTM